MKNFAKEVFKNIPQNSKIAIYGSAGAKPFMILDFIKNERKDVKVVYFIDSFNKGQFSDFEVKLPSDIKNEDADFILVLSDTSYREISVTLNAYTKIPVIFIKDYNKDFNYQGALNLLSEKGDKELYKTVVDCAKKQDFTALKKHINIIYKNGHPAFFEYIDFIDKDKIETVISGGSYNGLTAMRFKYEFKNARKIYMFEPLYEQFKTDSYDGVFQDSDCFSMNKFGLWDKKEEQIINIGDSGSRIDPKACQVESNQTIIKTTSVDEFVKENSIKKIDFIKLDIEGAEIRALNGAQDTIKKDRPQMAICIYHSITDYYEIPLYLDSFLENYVYRLGHYHDGPYSTVLYAVPKELHKSCALKTL